MINSTSRKVDKKVTPCRKSTLVIFNDCKNIKKKVVLNENVCFFNSNQTTLVRFLIYLSLSLGILYGPTPHVLH